ncbi:MAG: hypothetical protein SWO11_11125 [Thermodesulfobacteriota bacterium]|nr:hypothetical protein [Thermodesulfobacteriota bacterium]
MIQEHNQKSPGPWPWYSLILTGFVLTGFFPWLIMIWALYKRGRKRTAIISFIICLLVFVFLTLFSLKSRMDWWSLILFIYAFNIVWASTAWLLQRRLLGPSTVRYVLREWKSWIPPLLTGMTLGVCVATILSILPALQERIQLREIGDTLDRQSVLWNFFDYSYFGLFAGLFVGLWWAGERQRFTVAHVFTFLCALPLTFIIYTLFILISLFLIHKGSLPYSWIDFSSEWSLIPPWVDGFRMYVSQIQTFDVSLPLIVSLLFGAVYRFRDFIKRTLLIPLAFFCSFPIIFSQNAFWSGIQDQIVYEMFSPDSSQQAKAHMWAEIMLSRYPNHLHWPRIAEKVARYKYTQGEYKESKAIYESINRRYEESNQWYWYIGRARAALNDPDYGKPFSGHKLTVPMVSYEEYLTHNWMALLSVIRYWQGPQVPESHTTIELNTLSRDNDKIDLNPLTTFAELDDAAKNLGYEVYLLPAELNQAKSLISAGIPIIHQHYSSFNVIFGFDENRSLVHAYSFEQLSKRLRRMKPKEANEILSITEEGHGKTIGRLIRTANEAYFEYSFDHWKSPALKYAGPLIAIVFPPEKANTIAKVLNMPLEAIKKETKGYLATLIGLSYLNLADPTSAIEWGKIGADKIANSMPLYISHLAKVLWESRYRKVQSMIPLQNQFYALAQIFDFFNKAKNKVFLERARMSFETDLNEKILPWFVLQEFISMLDISDVKDANVFIKEMEEQLSLDPSRPDYWESLAKTYEWTEDTHGMVSALCGLISAQPMNWKGKLRLAYGYVLLERYAEAKSILKETYGSAAKSHPDYFFCLAAIEESEGRFKKALTSYKKAVNMRPYKPEYHLRYGSLLLKLGQDNEGKKALEWAVRIDGGESIMKKVQQIRFRSRTNALITYKGN